MLNPGADANTGADADADADAADVHIKSIGWRGKAR